MSRIISYSTADQAHIVAFLGAGDSLSADQRDHLAAMRESAQAHQLRLERQDIDWGLTVPDALDHLIAGHADSTAEYAANAYYTALQHIIDANASDPADLGSYSKPSTFFGLLDDELRRLGVDADLLPHGYLFAGPPDGIPFRLPHPMDGSPDFGRLPLAKAKPAADAYRRVLDRIDPDLTYDVRVLIDMLDEEHDNWIWARERLDWYTQDTLFFSIKG
ncbi:DUF7691 family protein [Streptomyces mobaraensis]|uniref:DUF7691 domain-containing protein n=1 Tax=Streptomyces mobaraensis TaxID=35621 RepID=A0A5N5W769_STRMB|nr:hypothetical protein [Streptomyces mobaraensis]KAB7843022.1 hypothetical protein FRZ00_18810 [Streptomyces mobaraensis]